MGQTQIYGWPYPSPGDSPDVPRDMRLLAEAVEPDVAALASAVQALTDRVDVLEGIVRPGRGWTVYTPAISGHGSATFSTLTGRWRRTGVLTVHMIAYVVVATAGSGTSNVMIGAPTDINRATRQTITAAAEGMAGGGGGNRDGYAVSLTSGAGAMWDRIRLPDGQDSHLDNLQGQHLNAGMILVLQGTYQEEEA